MGTGTIGTTATFAPGITGYATFSGQGAQPGVVTYGGQIGLNAALRQPIGIVVAPADLVDAPGATLFTRR